MKIDVKASLSGRFKCVTHKDGVVSSETEFDNLILDSGLERWGTGEIIDRCSIGSGSTPPAVTDINLTSLIATSTTSRTVTPSITANATSRWTEVTTCFRFGEGVGTGTISEVGVGWNGGLWSKTLIKDGSGNPTTITKLADETLDVYYTLRIQYPLADITGSAVLKGVNYDYVLRPASIGANPSSPSYLFGSKIANGGRGWVYNSTIGAVDTQPGLSSWMEGATTYAYVAGSKTARVKFYAGLDYANVSGGFKSVVMWVVGGYGHDAFGWQMGFYSGGAPVSIPKTNAEIFSVTLDFTWARGS
ncbi:MAG: hypothetical protein ACRCTX_03625 [Afipia sp.]